LELNSQKLGELLKKFPKPLKTFVSSSFESFCPLFSNAAAKAGGVEFDVKV